MFRAQPPYVHAGDSPFYACASAAGGVTDLAGNDLAEGVPGIDFTIDPESPRLEHGSS